MKTTARSQCVQTGPLRLEDSNTGTNPSAPSDTVLDPVERIAIGASPRSASWTQRRNTLAFSPRAKATDAIDTPGCWQAPTASALKNTLWCGCRCRPVVRAFSVVSMCPPNPLAKSDRSSLTSEGVR